MAQTSGSTVAAKLKMSRRDQLLPWRLWHTMTCARVRRELMECSGLATRSTAGGLSLTIDSGWRDQDLRKLNEG
jgi:hypothetical protein